MPVTETIASTSIPSQEVLSSRLLIHKPWICLEINESSSGNGTSSLCNYLDALPYRSPKQTEVCPVQNNLYPNNVIEKVTFFKVTLSGKFYQKTFSSYWCEFFTPKVETNCLIKKFISFSKVFEVKFHSFPILIFLNFSRTSGIQDLVI